MPVTGRSKPIWDNSHGTSGSIATTVFDSIRLIEHATRRAGGIASSLTPEQIDMGLENLYLILTSLSNRGVNLWCLDKQIINLNPNQARYTLPPGTVTIQKPILRRITPLAATAVLGPDRQTLTLPSAAMVRHVGIRFSTPMQVNIAIDYTNDTQPWKQLATVSKFVNAGEWIWLDLDPSFACTGFRVRDVAGITLQVSQIVVADVAVDLPMSPLNRDDYHALPNKAQPGMPINYYLEMLIPPIIAVWPLPQEANLQMVVWRQRQPQDVGGALDKIEVPERWFECICWMLAANMAYELPNIPADRIQLCKLNADDKLREAEAGETDGMPLKILPNISGYTI